MPDLNTNNTVKRNSSKNAGANAAVLKAMIAMLVVLTVVCASLGYMVYSEYAKNQTPEVIAANNNIVKNSVNSGNDDQSAMLAAVETDKIYDNIFINGVGVGQMTKSQAQSVLNEELTVPLEEKTITLTYEGKAYELTYKAFMAGYELDAALQTAFSYARNGSVLDRFNKVNELKTKPFEITATYFYDENAVKNAISALENEINIPAVNAAITRVDGEFITTKEQPGKKLDVNATALLVTELVRVINEGTVEMVVSEDKPRFYESDLANAQSLIGTFTTKTTTGNTSRNVNLKNALSKINNAVIYPGEVFSTNEYFGEMSEKNGYAYANVIVGGKFEEGIGGGVCQVSSTLYMALLHAELEIVERTNHSLKVTYADYGYDATLAGDYIDLKFKNNTDYPLVIEGYMEGGNVIVNVYGNEIHSPGRTLKFSNKQISTTPAPEGKVIEDPNLPLGQRVEETPARSGYKYQLIKSVYDNGVEIESVVVNTSNYKATASEVRVGTNPNLVNENKAGESAANNGEEAAQQQPPQQQTEPPDSNVGQSEWPDGVPGAPTDLSEFTEPAELDLSIINALRKAGDLP